MIGLRFSGFFIPVFALHNESDPCEKLKFNSSVALCENSVTLSVTKNEELGIEL